MQPMEMTPVLRCIRYLEKVIWIETKADPLTTQDQKLLESLITNELIRKLGNDPKYHKSDAVYRQSIFHQYCISKEKVYIVDMDSNDPFVIRFFMANEYHKWHWISFDSLGSLFPNIKELWYCDWGDVNLCKNTMNNIYTTFKKITG
eukprot:806710_1